MKVHFKNRNKINMPRYKPKIGIIGLKGLPAFGGAATVGENLISILHNEYDFKVYSVASHTNNRGIQIFFFII